MLSAGEERVKREHTGLLCEQALHSFKQENHEIVSFIFYDE